MMRQTPITDSDVRSAHHNAVGGKRDRCRQGKPCSAACINREMVCLVDLPYPIAVSVSQVRDYIEKAKLQMLGGTDAQGQTVRGEFQLLRTPKEAAEWLLAHKEELALWGIDEFKLRSVLKYHPEIITVGVEPGTGGGGAVPAVTRLVPDVKNLQSVIQEKGVGQNKVPAGERGSFFDQMAKVNDYKLALETSQYLSKVGPEVFGKTYTDRVGHLVSAGFNADKFLKELEESGNFGNGFYKAGGVGAVHDKVSRPWDRGLRDIARNMDLPFGTLTSGLNPSGLYKPDENYNQFGELFKAAGMADKAGPFESQSKWIAYSGNAVKGKFEEIFQKANPNLMWITESKNSELVKSILLTPGNSNSSTFKFEAVNNQGKPTSANATFVIRNYPNGERGVIVSSNHPGSGFKGSEQTIRPHILQVARFMKETGRAPSESELEKIRAEALKLEGNRPVTSIIKQENPGDRIKREAGDKLIKELAREGKQEKADVQGQEKLDRKYEVAQERAAKEGAFKLIDQIRGEGKPVQSTRTLTPRAESNNSSLKQPGQFAQRVVNLPNGQFNANDLWAALDEYNQSKRKKDWVPQMRDILRSVREEQGGFVSKGPKADEVRRRLQGAGLLPRSEPSKNADSEPTIAKQRLIDSQKEVYGTNNFSELPSVSEVHRLKPSVRGELQPRAISRHLPTTFG